MQVQDEQVKIAHTDYGFPLTASIQKANIYGVQFHPESIATEHGHRLLKNFLSLAEAQRR